MVVVVVVGGGSHSGDSKSHSHSHSHGEATTFSQGDEEEHIGTEENEHTPLLYNITHTTMKSTPSEVFDYLPDNVVERYSNYQPSFSGQSPLNGTSANSSDANTVVNNNNTLEHSGTNNNTPQSALQKIKQKSMNMEGVFYMY